MANRKSTERGTRKITKSGGSLSVSLPIEMVKSLGWREKQKVTVKKKGGALVVRDQKTKKPHAAKAMRGKRGKK
jgi:antitoxin component of MazEF toxin-antitoxin module